MDFRESLKPFQSLKQDFDVCIMVPVLECDFDFDTNNFVVHGQAIVANSKTAIAEMQLDFKSPDEPGELRRIEELFSTENSKIVFSKYKLEQNQIYLLLKGRDSSRMAIFQYKERKLVYQFDLKENVRKFFILCPFNKHCIVFFKRKVMKLDFISEELDPIFKTNASIKTYGFWKSEDLFWFISGGLLRFISIEGLMLARLPFRWKIKMSFAGKEFLVL